MKAKLLPKIGINQNKMHTRSHKRMSTAYLNKKQTHMLTSKVLTYGLKYKHTNKINKISKIFLENKKKSQKIKTTVKIAF